MNEAVVDGMSRREVVNALDSRGIEYRDLLEVEDADLRAGDLRARPRRTPSPGAALRGSPRHL
jgi:hypothetical protein